MLRNATLNCKERRNGEVERFITQQHLYIMQQPMQTKKWGVLAQRRKKLHSVLVPAKHED